MTIEEVSKVRKEAEDEMTKIVNKLREQIEGSGIFIERVSLNNSITPTKYIYIHLGVK